MAMIYFMFDWIKKEIMARIFSQVTINHDDDAFKWVLKYLKEKDLLAHDNVLFCNVKESRMEWYEEIFMTKDDKRKPDIEYNPGAGIHAFMYKGTKMWVHHQEGEIIMTGWERRPTRQDKINLYVWGQNTEPIKQFMEDCITLSMKKDDGKVKIWELHPWGWCGWRKV